MKQINLKLILSFLSISVLSTFTLDTSLIADNITTSIINAFMYILLLISILACLNIINNIKKGSYLSIKTNIIIIIVSIVYMLIKTLLPLIFNISSSDVNPNVLIIYVVLLMLFQTFYINYLISTIQDKLTIKKAIINELIIILAIIIISLLTSLTTNITNNLLKDISNIIITMTVFLTIYCVSLKIKYRNK